MRNHHHDRHPKRIHRVRHPRSILRVRHRCYRLKRIHRHDRRPKRYLKRSCCVRRTRNHHCFHQMREHRKNRRAMEADTNRLAVNMIQLVDHTMRMAYGNRIHRRLLVVRPSRRRLKQQLPVDGQAKKKTN